MAKEIDLSIIIPCFNEANRLPTRFKDGYEKIKQFNKSFEIILVNDGSVDGTQLALEKLAKSYSNVQVISYPNNQGKGFAVKKGVEKALGRVIGFMDADFAISLNELPKFTQTIESGADICIPDRNDSRSHAIKEQTIQRRILGRVLSTINNFFLGLGDISDTQCGFKFFKNVAAKRIFDQLTINRWMFDLELILIAKKLKYKIEKQPVSWEGVDNSKVSVGRDLYSVFKELWQIYSTFFNLKLYIVLTGFLLMIVLAPFLVSPANLTHRNGDYSDLVWPDYFFIKSTLANFHQLPLWNPTLFSGIPEIANPQSPLIYPPNILTFILPIDLGIVILIFLHLLICGSSWFKAFNELLKWKNSPSFVASYVFIFSPFLWSKFAVGHLSQGFAICLVGPIAYFSLKIFQKVDLKNCLFLSIALSLQYLNYPTIWYYTLFFGLPIYLYFGWVYQKLKMSAVLIITSVLSLIWILPIFLVQLKAGSWITRTELNLADLSIPIWSIKRFLLSVFIPSNLISDNETEVWLYPSIIALALGGWGFIKLKLIYKLPVLVCAVLILLITLGGRTPVFGWFSQYIPGFTYLRVSTRDWFVVIGLLSISVGWFFQTFRNQSLKQVLMILVILDLIVFSIARIWLVPDFMKPENSPNYSQLLHPENDFRYYCTNRCLSARDTLPMGINTADGYHLIILKNYRQALSQAGGFPLPKYTGNIPGYEDRFAQPDAVKLGQFAVKWVISENPLTDPNLYLTTVQSNARLYRNLAALPRIRFANPQNRISLSINSPNLLELETEGSQDKLIVADSFFPGWYASIDGKPTEIALEDGWARSITVPAGHHKIRFEYQPFLNLIKG